MFGHAGDNWKLVANFSFNNRDNTFNRDFEWTEPAIDPFANNFTDLDPEWGFDYYNFTALPGGCNGPDTRAPAPVRRRAAWHK